MVTDLRERLKGKATANGAQFFGVADLAPARDFIVEQGGGLLAQYPVAVSIGYRLLDGIVDGLENHNDPMAISTYRYHIYQVVNPRLDSVALDIAQELQRAGHSTIVVPSSYTVDTGNLTGLVSHKLAAHLAGLGWIGKSALLVTPECGARSRWCTILTDAPLQADEPFQGEKCAGCTKCVEACPAQAFTGTAFDVVRPRSEIFAAEKCHEYMRQRRDIKNSSLNACGMCVYVCPYGQKTARPDTTAN